jgi:hypothetical protein
MSDIKLKKIEKLIIEKKITDAQYEISRLGEEYYRNANYLYLRGKIFYLNKLYYAAIDALLISLEFEENEKIYNLIAEIYDVLGNHELKEKILDPEKRVKAINLLKDQLTGIYRK